MNQFVKNLPIGEAYERKVVDYLNRSNNLSIIPLYQFDCKKKPYCLCNGVEVTLPDITVTQDGKTRFIECKYKARWTYGDETGFDLRLWHEYKQLYEFTGVDIEFYFIHTSEYNNPNINDPYAGVYYNTLSKLEACSRVRVKTKQQDHDEISFKRSQLNKLCEIEGLIKNN